LTGTGPDAPAASPEAPAPAPEAMATRLLRLEAMVIAQRKLLIRLVARTGLAAALRDDFAERKAFEGHEFGGHEEDPGVLPSPEFALEAAIAEEISTIAREMEGLAAAPPAAG